MSLDSNTYLANCISCVLSDKNISLGFVCFPPFVSFCTCTLLLFDSSDLIIFYLCCYQGNVLHLQCHYTHYITVVLEGYVCLCLSGSVWVCVVEERRYGYRPELSGNDTNTRCTCLTNATIPLPPIIRTACDVLRSKRGRGAGEDCGREKENSLFLQCRCQADACVRSP